MNLEIDIGKDLFNQFNKQLKGTLTEGRLVLDSSIGKGNIVYQNFPNKLQTIHFQFKLNEAVSMNSANPMSSEWLLINVNLSKVETRKNVNQQPIHFHRFLPSGILFYPPGTKVSSNSQTDQEYEVLLVRFHQSMLSDYLEGEEIKALSGTDKSIIYEDLNYRSEELLKATIASTNAKIKRHAALLDFLGILFEKLKSREIQSVGAGVHPEDLKALFVAAAHLRNPLSSDVPSVETLAQKAGMGMTKFKKTFKHVFGSPVKTYHLRIKMEYAQKELEVNGKSSSELSYALGYSHPSKFTSAFKKHFGRLPSDKH